MGRGDPPNFKKVVRGNKIASVDGSRQKLNIGQLSHRQNPADE